MNHMNEKLALKEGRISLVGNIVLFAIKLWAGMVSASSALIADAWHTMSDSLSSLIIIIAAKVSGKKPDEDHPFGHGRAELIAAMIVGILLVLIAVDFFIEGIHRLSDHTEATYGLIAIVVTALSILVKEAMAQYAFFAYRKCKSLSLKADGWHHRSDAISSVIILVGIFVGKFVWWADGALTLIVAVMIAWTAYHIIKDGIRPLLGEAPDDDLLSYLKSTCDDVLRVKSDVHHVHMHRYGDHIEITFHVSFPENIILKDAHDQVTLIENRLREERRIEATIHPEPLSIHN